MTGVVQAVHLSPTHSMAKAPQPAISLLAGLGVEGDAHLGTTVQHRSRLRRDPARPNLRQVHLIAAELYDELRGAGFDLTAGRLGENITTRTLDLLGLATGALLHIGREAVVEVTGLRNPCRQLDAISPGLMQAVLDRDEHGKLIRKAGVMAVVRTGGRVRPGNSVVVEAPASPYRALEPV